MPPKNILIVGYGYLGREIASRIDRDSYQIFATTRKSERFRQIKKDGVKPVLWDVCGSQPPPDLELDCLIYCVGYDRTSEQSKRTIYVEGLERTLAAIGKVNEAIYVSSTSVYGQSDGEWVDEDSPTEPTYDGGKICLEAESKFWSWSAGQASHKVLRLAGIYGPGRVPNRAKLEQGVIDVDGESYLNLIHVADAAGIIVELISRDGNVASSTFTVSDGVPVQRQDYYRQAAELMGLDPPRFDAPADKQNRRGGGSKRVSNRNLRERLPEYQWKFSDYRTGLRSALKTEIK